MVHRLALLLILALSTAANATTIKFCDDVTPDSMNALVAKVAQASAAGDRNITIQLDSGGGNLGAALNANRQLKAYGVNTFVKGDCSSSCTVLFAAGKTRTASDGATFMFHAALIDHINSKLLYNKKKNPNGKTRQQYVEQYAGNWLEAVRWASPSLAATLLKNKTLLIARDSDNSGVTYSGREMRKTGYVND